MISKIFMLSIPLMAFEGLVIDTYTPINDGKTQIILFLGDTDVSKKTVLFLEDS